MSDDWPPPLLPPRAAFREECWTLYGPTGKLATYWIEEVAGRYEMRAGYSDTDILSTSLVPDLPKAREIATILYEELTTHGKFTKVNEKPS